MLPAAPPAIVSPAPTPVAAFLAAHPRYAVLPAPYFEPGRADASWLDLDLRPGAYLGHGRAWSVEVDTGRVVRLPAHGCSREAACQVFLPLGDRPPTRVEVRLYGVERGDRHLAARFTLPVRPQHFTSVYTTGPYTHQVSRAWGEDGAALVLIQQRYPAVFDRLRHPVFYVGGDFNYQRIEGLVRYFRTHGVDALGYKPDYDRDPTESLLAMGRADLPDVREWLRLASGGQPAHLIGLCLGGLHARGMAFAERLVRETGAPGPAPLFASLTTVGTPNDGSALADVYNGVPALPLLHRWLSGDPRVHRYKDARAEMTGFNRQVGTDPGVPLRCVVLDATGRRLDPRYTFTAGPLQWLAARETGRPAGSIHTDGLILAEGQAIGRPYATWNTDHAGMINDGLASTYFDAYAAHERLLDGLEPGEGRP